MQNESLPPRSRIDQSLESPPRSSLAEADDVAPTCVSFAPAPERLGPYHILGLLGEGGMGAVYKAEQRSPIRRTVAVKLVKAGFDTREVIARFQAERQALARMDHPHIAKVLDAGADELGRPYFVMEFVPGMSLTHFCDQQKMSITQRLELFCQACDAIAHAHTKALIHRDIKASNVLAYMHDGGPTVKVIDFGIAKALTGDRLTDQTFDTARGVAVGTYDSMSPEQAEGSPDIDTRTDVYSLGVLLYELLAGVKPFEHDTFANNPDHEIRRIIREVEPQRPSTRLSALGERAERIAAARCAQSDSLARQLRSELEWIPLKAMRKERDRRYANPQQIVEDIDRYLGGRPLLAGPESGVYRLRKFLTRNRAAVVSTAAAAFALAVGISIYLHNIHAEQARTRAALREATERTAAAYAAEDFVLHTMTNATSEGGVADNDAAFLSAVHLMTISLDSGRLRDQPQMEAYLRGEIGMQLANRHHFEQALPHLQRALEIRRKLLAPTDPYIAQMLNNIAWWHMFQGDYRQAEPILREAVDIVRKSCPLEDPEVAPQVAQMLNGLGFNLRNQNRAEEAEPLVREAVAIERKVRGAQRDPDHPELSNNLNNLAATLLAEGKLTEAESAARESLAMRRRRLPTQQEAIARSLDTLGAVLAQQHKLQEAQASYAEALKIWQVIDGPSAEQTIQTAAALAAVQKNAAPSTQAERTGTIH